MEQMIKRTTIICNHQPCMFLLAHFTGATPERLGYILPSEVSNSSIIVKCVFISSFLLHP